MSGLGAPEIIVICGVLVAFLLPIWLILFLKRRFPGRMWLGILLAVCLAPMGQLYLDGALKWFFLLFGVYVVTKVATGSMAMMWITTSVLSGAVMYYRLLKAAAPKG